MDFNVSSNGIYIKFTNGLLITIHQVTCNLSRTATWGNMYETTEPADLGNFPMEFKDTPYEFLTLYNSNALFEAVQNSTKNSAGSVYIIAPTLAGSTNYTIQVLAFGRWK